MISEAQTGTSPPVGPAPTVDADRFCIRCGYLLRGLALAGRCPECGTEVALSLREPTLATASSEYLVTLRRGLSLVLNTILLIFVIALLTVVAVAVFGPNSPALWAAEGASVLNSLAMLWGYWLFTEPDPGQVAVETHKAARRVVRVAVSVLAATTILRFVLPIISPVHFGPAGAQGGGGLVTGVIGVTALAAWIVQFFATMRYTRWLGGRVPDQFIVRRTKSYMWVLPVVAFAGCIAAFIGPLVALVLYWNLLDRLRKHVRAVIRTGEPAKLPKMAG